jgi:two-component system sensor kinase FixL
VEIVDLGAREYRQAGLADRETKPSILRHELDRYRLADGSRGLHIGLAQPPRAARLLFALSALAVAVVSGLELAMMRTDVLAQWWPLMRWMDIAVGVMIVSLTAFIWVYFGTGNKWLALAVPCLYALGLVFDYFPGPPGSGMTYRMVTGFRTVETFGGAVFSVAEGVPNPWNVLPYAAVLTLIVFVTDASVRVWRRGEHRRAAVIGGAIVFFFLAAGAHSAMVETGIVRTPYLISWSYLAILLAMGGELNADVLAGARLARQLKESERRMEVASSAANLGMWAWDIVPDRIWASSRARSLLGFSETERLSGALFLSALLPADREAVERRTRHRVPRARP